MDAFCHAQGRDNLHYSIRCSFLEIYNENITDLLNPSSTNLHIRDNMRHGCYVDGLTEHMILNGESFHPLSCHLIFTTTLRLCLNRSAIPLS